MYELTNSDTDNRVAHLRQRQLNFEHSRQVGIDSLITEEDMAARKSQQCRLDTARLG